MDGELVAVMKVVVEVMLMETAKNIDLPLLVLISHWPTEEMVVLLVLNYCSLRGQ